MVASINNATGSPTLIKKTRTGERRVYRCLRFTEIMTPQGDTQAHYTTDSADRSRGTEALNLKQAL